MRRKDRWAEHVWESRKNDNEADVEDDSDDGLLELAWKNEKEMEDEISTLVSGIRYILHYSTKVG